MTKGDVLYWYFGNTMQISAVHIVHMTFRELSLFPFSCDWLSTLWDSLLPFIVLARSQYCEKRLWDSSCLPVQTFAWNNSAHTWWIFMKFDIWICFENLSRKFKFHYNLTSKTGTLHEDQYTFLITFRSVLFRQKNVSHRDCRENQNTHFCSITFFRKSCRLWDVEKIVEPDKPQMTIWRMRNAC